MKTGTLDQKTFTDSELKDAITNLVDAINLMGCLYGDRVSLTVRSMINDWLALHQMADARGLEHKRLR